MSGFCQCRKSRILAETFQILTQAPRNSVNYFQVCLPHPTQRKYLESLSPIPHLESTLTGRYIGFVDSLAKSKKPLLKLLFSLCGSNLGSQTGQNIKFLHQT